MGAVSSKEAVHENMVAAVLLGQIAKDDYLARAHKALTELEVGEPPSFAAQPWMEFYNVHLMLVPGPQPLEHGMVRLSDGTWYIAVKTDLGTAINGDMFDWWFRHCTGDERFKWLHPRDHKSGDWNPQFYAAQPEDRPRGYYVHHSHKTSEYIGGRTVSFQMEYDRPSKFFNVAKFAEAGVTAVVCGRLHILETLGLAGIAHVVHMVRVVNGRSELRTRIYLGDFNKVDDNSILPLWCINSLGNSKLSRFTKNPRSLAVGLWRHTVEEMHCLKSFLPDFYTAETMRLRALKPFELRAAEGTDAGGGVGGDGIEYFQDNPMFGKSGGAGGFQKPKGY